MRKTQLDKAIDVLDGEIAVLQLAKARLVQQRTKAPARRPRAVDPVKDERAG